MIARAAARPEDEPPWLYFYDETWFTLQRGMALTHLRAWPQAIEYLTAGLAALPGDYRRDRTWYRACPRTLVRTLAGAGEPDAALAVALDIVPDAAEVGRPHSWNDSTARQRRCSARLPAPAGTSSRCSGKRTDAAAASRISVVVVSPGLSSQKGRRVPPAGRAGPHGGMSLDRSAMVRVPDVGRDRRGRRAAATIGGMAVDRRGEEVAFRRAGADRVDDVLGVLDEAAGWLAARGVSQWPARFEAAWVAEAVARGETWLVEFGGGVAGTVTLDWADPLWADVGGTAGYVHRMAVRRRAAGLGGVILDWAADTARRRDVDALRLDCVRSNEALRSYYQARGFTHRGDVPVGGAPGQRRDEGPVTWVSRYELVLRAG